MTAFLFGLSVAAGLVVVALIRANLRKLTVFEYEWGLRYVRGRFVGVMEPRPVRGGEQLPPLPDRSESTES
jgi:hypothetical protein